MFDPFRLALETGGDRATFVSQKNAPQRWGEIMGDDLRVSAFYSHRAKKQN